MRYLSDCRSESRICRYIKVYFASILGKFRVNQKTVCPEQAGSTVAKHWRAGDEDITKRSSSATWEDWRRNAVHSFAELELKTGIFY